jgi:hypothetical protein
LTPYSEPFLIPGSIPLALRLPYHSRLLVNGHTLLMLYELCFTMPGRTLHVAPHLSMWALILPPAALPESALPLKLRHCWVCSDNPATETPPPAWVLTACSPTLHQPLPGCIPHSSRTLNTPSRGYYPETCFLFLKVFYSSVAVFSHYGCRACLSLIENKTLQFLCFLQFCVFLSLWKIASGLSM